MIPGLKLPNGSLLIDTTTPGAGKPSLGGFSLNPATNAVYVLNGTGSNFIGGHMATGAGQLCIAPGGTIAGFVNGLPVTADGRLVTQNNQTPAATDPFVGEIRVGPLGGVYTSTTPPTAPTGFDTGFSNGFGA